MPRPPRAERPPIETLIEGTEETGEGWGRVGDRIVRAWGALPGERVLVAIRKRKGGVWTGFVSEVLEASADRIAPRESHYLCCSPWQVLDPGRENAFKQEAVRRMAADKHGIELPEFEVEGEIGFGYRNKLEFGFFSTDAGLSLSFFMRGGSGWRIPIDGCELGSEAIGRCARRIVARLNELQVTSRQVKSLVLRSNRRGEVVAGLYARDPIPAVGPLDDVPELVGLRVYRSNPKSPASVVDSVAEDHGAAAIVETLDGHPFELTDRSFFQVNVPCFERALEAIRAEVPTGSPLVDLYAGVGSIGIGLGIPGTLFVESDPTCVACLETNVARAGLAGATILGQPAEAGLPEWPRGATVIVDPPRVGLHPKVVRRLAETPPARLIYLSCNPETQARDLAAWGAAFRLVGYRAFNFFPRTPHLETLAILEPR